MAADTVQVGGTIIVVRHDGKVLQVKIFYKEVAFSARPWGTITMAKNAAIKP